MQVLIILKLLPAKEHDEFRLLLRVMMLCDDPPLNRYVESIPLHPSIFMTIYSLVSLFRLLTLFIIKPFAVL